MNIWGKEALDPESQFSTLAAHWNHWGDLANTDSGPTPRNCDLFGLVCCPGAGIFKTPGDSNG